MQIDKLSKLTADVVLALGILALALYCYTGWE